MSQKKADPSLIKKLDEYKAKNEGVSWATIANGVGTSSGALSQWRAGKYVGSYENLNKLIDQFLRIEDKRAFSGTTSELDFVEITNNKRVWRILETAHTDGVIGMITGDTGTSKTESVRQYAKNNDVIYLQANRTFKLPIDYLRRIHMSKRVGKDGRGTLNMLCQDIIEELRGTNTLIVIDQADYLHLSTIDIFRTINEEAGVGVVFVGLPSLLRKIRGNEPEVRQVRDRIRVKIELQSYTAEEADRILQINWPDLNGLSTEFYRQSCGSLRILAGIVYNARRIMASPKNAEKGVNADLIAKASNYLEIRTA